MGLTRTIEKKMLHKEKSFIYAVPKLKIILRLKEPYFTTKQLPFMCKIIFVYILK